MPASKQVDLTAITATVKKAVGVMASAKALVTTQGDVTKAAVKAALEADNVTDDNFVDVAMAAIDATTKELSDGVDDLAGALTANPGPTA